MAEQGAGRRPIRAGVVTVSDGVSAGRREDRSGELLCRLVEQAGGRVEFRRVVPDEAEQIRRVLLEAADVHRLDLVVTTGGTGLAPRDVTPEATLSVVERLVPGLPEAMRWAALARTPTAMLSRAVAGVRGRTLIVNLPGSPRGVQESWQAIAGQLPHAVALLRGEQGLHEPGEKSPGAPPEGAPGTGDG
ncbi:MAG TPA: MogA/MoaB family molybdenum cofactor biosynthesis protein [Limnochordales bacterium]